MKKKSVFRVLCVFAALVVFGASVHDNSGANAFQTKIIGGVESVPGSWPWVAYLDISEDEDQTMCGGSLISPQWILTAAHCTVDAQSINVVLGRHNIESGEGQVIPVEQWFEFPFYDDEEIIADISLLKLAWPADYPTIPVIGINESAGLLSPGKIGMVVGWGNTVPGARDDETVTSDVLRQVELPVIDDDLALQVMRDYAIEHMDDGDIDFDELYSPEVIEKYRESMFFAGYLYDKIDSGQGDSGGPFMLRNNAGGWILAGLVSWGFEDAAQGAYGAYTRVSTYDYWITDIVDGSRVYDYLEEIHPEFFEYEKARSETMDLFELPIHYRCYESTDACLVITHGHLFYIGPLSDYEFLPADTLNEWLPHAEQAGY